MCLILFAHKVHPQYPLVLAANRDEQYNRPTATASFWTDFPQIHAGRDLEHGGTWLGITRTGRIAAVTNFRDDYEKRIAAPSRGQLVSDFLRATQSGGDYVEQVSRDAHAYNGFNLIVGDLDRLFYLCNRGGRVTTIEPGIHGLSNHLLDTPWPKVERGKKILADLLLRETRELIEGLFAVLGDRAPAADELHADTGGERQRQHVHSPAFIISPTYGTRSSTVLLVDKRGQVIFAERNFGERGKAGRSTTARFTLEALPTEA